MYITASTTLQNQKKRAMRFVLITVFIYSAGFGIIMPALPDLIRALEGVSLSQATQTGALIGATYAIFQFALGPLVGNLGDRFGRRPVFLTSLFCFGLDFLLMGMAGSIIWLFIGRAIAGGLGAIFGPANAAMADLSDDSERAASFGKVGAAFGTARVCHSLSRHLWLLPISPMAGALFRKRCPPNAGAALNGHVPTRWAR
jgi:MFS transporter, DHA1 family, tetracycline resistance protein